MTAPRPRALDLFCGGGGSSYGLALAGYEVTGVDTVPQPRYPFAFICADALTIGLSGYDLICASPPCQAYTSARHIRDREHPRLIGPVRERLAASGTPWVLENVPGAPLTDPVMLCGGMFGLKVWRHRLFEASWPISQPGHPAHSGNRPKTGRPPSPGDVITVVGRTGDVNYARAAMGAWWMSQDELRESAPPAYSFFVALAAAAFHGHQIQPGIMTLEDPREAARKAANADAARRYRARLSGRDIPLQKRGRKPKMLNHYAAELARARTEIAALRIELASRGEDPGDR